MEAGNLMTILWSDFKMLQIGNGMGWGNLPGLQVGVPTGQGTGCTSLAAIPGVPVVPF